ncbi:MAG: hypothetical protein PHY73_00655 [Candidatus Omnitrophica bacterium]|nr:hypothetical protein [Candidatus Omnitrophota bacterium]
MLQIFNQWLRFSCRPQRKRLQGQIAIVLVVFLAILLVLTSVIINLGKISQIKTALTVVSDTTAAVLASSVASYVEAYYMEGIRDNVDCPSVLTVKGAGWGKQIVGFIIDLVCAVGLTIASLVPGAAAVTGKAAGNAWINVGADLVEMGVKSIGQGKIISSWNKSFSDLEINQQIRDQGLMTALQSLVTDSFQLPEIGDDDMDGYYYGDGTPEGTNEKISRFNFLFGKRVHALAEKSYDRTNLVKLFQRALGEFVTKGGGSLPFDSEPLDDDGWGLWDSGWHEDIPDVGTYHHNEYDDRCDASASPLDPACPDNGTPWRYIYDPYYERFSNVSFESFREFIGRDDENQLITFAVNGNAIFLNSGEEQWLEQDTRGQLYPFLWKLDKLAMWYEVRPPYQTDEENCYWSGFGFDGMGNKRSGFCEDYPDSLNLALTYGSMCLEYPDYDKERCWHAVEKLDTVNVASLNNNECYDSVGGLIWKKGANQYCSESLPYSRCPGKNCDPSCSSCCTNPLSCPLSCIALWTCGKNMLGNSVNNQDEWRNDAIDLFRYDKANGLDGLISKYLEIDSESPKYLAATFDDWYPGVEPWIRVGDVDNPGKLEKWVSTIEEIQNHITSFQNANYTLPYFPGICSGSLGDIKDCYDDALQNINTCFTECPENISICQNLADQFGLDFSEPPEGDQATGCHSDIPSGPNVYYHFIWEIKNIADKILQRKEFLFGPDGEGGLYKESQDIFNKLQEAKDKINGFLNDPRVKALRDYMNSASQHTPFSMGNNSSAVYAWRDDPKEGQEFGPWHIVFVEAKIPSLCNGNCRRTTCISDGGNINPSTNGDDCPVEPKFPEFYSYGNNGANFSIMDYRGKGRCIVASDYGNTNKCFKGGMTKVRVIRYDEPSGVLNWATGTNFWRNIFKHPDAESVSSPDLIAQQGYCGDIMAFDSVPGAFGTPGAFLLAEITDENLDCWSLMSDLLKEGVESRSCTEYFLGDLPCGHPSAFAIKFVDCKDAPDPW